MISTTGEAAIRRTVVPVLICPTLLLLYAAPVSGQINEQARRQQVEANLRARTQAAIAAFADGDFVSARDTAAGRGTDRALLWSTFPDLIFRPDLLGESAFRMGDNAAVALNTGMMRRFRLFLARMNMPNKPLDSNVWEPHSMPTWGPGSRRLPGVNVDRTRRTIARSVGLALLRRRQLLGPAMQNDLIAADVVRTLARTRPADPISRAWITVLTGLAMSGVGENQRAVGQLQGGLLVGRLDHPLTSLALLELGRLAMRAGKFERAAGFFLEASLVAARYDQEDIVEEALLDGLSAHIAASKPGVYAPLALAAKWADPDFPKLRASMLLAMAENAAELNLPTGELLLTARRAISDREMGAGRIGARVLQQTAIHAIRANEPELAASSLNQLLMFQRKSSLRLAHLAAAETQMAEGSLPPRGMDELYASVLRDTSPADSWCQPLEALTWSAHPPFESTARWLEIAVSRRDLAGAFAVSERLRRERFYASLPGVGSRGLSLKWLVESPPETLPQRAALQRDALLRKFPSLRTLLAEAEKTRAALGQSSADPQDALFKRLVALGASIDRSLAEISLRREACDAIFPPVTDLGTVQKALPPRTLLLSYTQGKHGWYAFGIDRERIAAALIRPHATVLKQIVNVLKQMGNWTAGGVVPEKTLRDKSHPDSARWLAGQLLRNPDLPSLDQYDEVVIVPDRQLWYLPFEALPIDERGNRLLHEKRVRYAPLASLAVASTTSIPRQIQTGIVDGQIVHRAEREEFVSAADRVARQIEGSTVVSAGLLVNPRYHNLVVFQSLDGLARIPGMPLRGPWAPTRLMLPGYSTAAAEGLRNGGTGDEIFLALTGMMAQGARTILLSRWATSGRSAYDLTGEFVRELPHATAASAWRRSVLLMNHSVIDPVRESRVARFRSDELLHGDHPFFWSGYLLVDRGRAP